MPEPKYLRSFWGVVGYRGREYSVGTGMLDITDPDNPQPFSDWVNFDWDTADIQDSAKVREPTSYNWSRFDGWIY